jgi:transcriptional/translational regulatory protein YebC/TACO1
MVAARFRHGAKFLIRQNARRLNDAIFQRTTRVDVEDFDQQQLVVVTASLQTHEVAAKIVDLSYQLADRLDRTLERWTGH